VLREMTQIRHRPGFAVRIPSYELPRHININRHFLASAGVISRQIFPRDVLDHRLHRHRILCVQLENRQSDGSDFSVGLVVDSISEALQLPRIRTQRPPPLRGPRRPQPSGSCPLTCVIHFPPAAALRPPCARPALAAAWDAPVGRFGEESSVRDSSLFFLLLHLRSFPDAAESVTIWFADTFAALFAAALMRAVTVALLNSRSMRIPLGITVTVSGYIRLGRVYTSATGLDI
jgi:hypothetical protein